MKGHYTIEWLHSTPVPDPFALVGALTRSIDNEDEESIQVLVAGIQERIENGGVWEDRLIEGLLRNPKYARRLRSLFRRLPKPDLSHVLRDPALLVHGAEYWVWYTGVNMQPLMLRWWNDTRGFAALPVSDPLPLSKVAAYLLIEQRWK